MEAKQRFSLLLLVSVLDMIYMAGSIFLVVQRLNHEALRLLNHEVLQCLVKLTWFTPH